VTRERTWFVDTNILIHVLKRSPLGAHLIEAGQFRDLMDFLWVTGAEARA
jgi:hypothetical protein